MSVLIRNERRLLGKENKLIKNKIMTQTQIDALNAIVTEMQAVDTTSLDGVVVANDKAVSDLQAFITVNSAVASNGSATPVVDPIVSITTTTQSGKTENFDVQAE